MSADFGSRSFGWPGIDLSVALVSGLVLLARRRAPFWVLGVLLALSVGYQAGGGTIAMTLPSVEVALYTVALQTRRVAAWATALVAVCWAVVTTVAFGSGPWQSPQRLGVIAWIAAAVALGDAVRSRRAVVDALRERAERAERTKAEEAARRVVEERVRIARDLHDVVAHQLILIHAQAGVGVYLEESGAAADPALLPQIRDGAKAALEELRDLVCVLAPPDEDGAPYQPTPRLDRLPDLVVSCRHAGLEVELREYGAAVELSAAVDVAAYRIVQEALTNVHRHAGVERATVELDWGRERLRLRVLNGPGTVGGRTGPKGPGNGRGTVSIKERASALGGRARLGRQGGGFLVEAELPYRGTVGRRFEGPAAEGPGAHGTAEAGV
ncbi:hypothetical protein WN71_024280 [Streptomyces mangrovisoli]|uniref:histidine kinase n=2 Tax=Streptomyces mangrovisoli TaxID=1428628 RepID=A0A1J4NSS6_9ACTN|nr:histidine kinase [Streptomyces mangrovisoli]OIJ65387.1 hypothetical protein WN71_024280 [Streptomyces mangrovisoli]